MTVRGPAVAESLGLTLPHEHLFADFAPAADTPQAEQLAHRLGSSDVRRMYEAPLSMGMLSEVAFGLPNRDNDRLGGQQLVAAEIAAYVGAGGGTIVELTNAASGRDPLALRRLAEATGVTIVMGAGPDRSMAEYRSAESTGRGAYAGADRITDAIADRITGELTEGIDGVRAGVIGEIPALDPEVQADRRVLEAVATASQRTGAPIVISRSADHDATLSMLRVLADGGADLGRVAMCGCSALSPHWDRIEQLLATGVYVMFDELGQLPTVASRWDDGDVAQAVAEFARRGYAGRILLSSGVSAKLHLLAYGGGGYAFVPGQYLPYLRMVAGADDALIDTLTVRNPQQFLTIAAGGAA